MSAPRAFHSVAPASVPVRQTFIQYRRNLPHWRLEGATYFVTWRLHTSQRELLPQERTAVLSALRHFDTQRYDLYAWVVMNDHVHVIVKPRPDWELRQLTHSWKSFTTNQLQRRFGRRGAVWQDESWDRIIRDEQEFWEKVEYIGNNPQKRWPDQVAYPGAGWQHPDQGADQGTGTEAGATAGMSTPPDSVGQVSVLAPIQLRWNRPLCLR